MGDITRFGNAKELQKLAGLELVSADSGKHNGRTKISKRGRKRLRYLLVQAAVSVIGKNDEFKEIHQYYTTRDNNHDHYGKRPPKGAVMQVFGSVV